MRVVFFAMGRGTKGNQAVFMRACLIAFLLGSGFLTVGLIS